MARSRREESAHVEWANTCRILFGAHAGALSRPRAMTRWALEAARVARLRRRSVGLLRGNEAFARATRRSKPTDLCRPMERVMLCQWHEAFGEDADGVLALARRHGEGGEDTARDSEELVVAGSIGLLEE